ncbi:MAG: caspase family protein, partial [Planctomycetota bacterium]
MIDAPHPSQTDTTRMVVDQAGQQLVVRCFAAFVFAAIVMWFVLAWLPPTASAEDRAFVVGVGTYQNPSFNDLPFAVNDILKFKEVLIEREFEVDSLYYDNENRPTINEQPLRQQILDRIQAMLRIASPGDRLIIAFAGHGVNINGDAYLCPVDGNLRNTESLVAVDQLFHWMKQSRGTQISLFIDACQQTIGPPAIVRAANLKVQAGLGSSEALRQQMMNNHLGMTQQKRTLLQSCSPGQFAYADDQLEHGVFFHYLIEAFKGQGDSNRDGQLHHAELTDHLLKKVQRHVQSRFGANQFVSARIDGNSPLPLLQLATGPTWLPQDCSPDDDSMLITLKERGQSERYYDTLVMNLTVPDPDGGMNRVPLLDIDDKPLRWTFQLVPMLNVNMPRTFYMLRDKVTKGDWEAYEQHHLKKLDQKAHQKRLRSSGDSKSPAFYVTGNEALMFCRDVWRGSDDETGHLPTPRQWDAAYGRDFDALKAKQLGYTNWLGRQSQQAGWAVGAASFQRVDRTPNPDV